MNWLDYIVLAGLAAAIVCIVLSIIRRKKRGEGSCGCCPHRDNCMNQACKKK